MYSFLQKFINVFNNRNHIRTSQKIILRTFLSEAYYCQEVWENRLNSPIIQKVKIENLYHELDHRYQSTRQISAVDVDIFANAVNDHTYSNELFDLLHKLRLSADTGNSLNSMSHAAIRVLMRSDKKEELLHAIDDRINYGLFLDYYTANILFDIFWKEKDFTSGARIASQLMLQEEFNHSISRKFSLLHCYKYLREPGNWPLPELPEEPEEEVKVRVRYIRNPYDDEHFDLRDPKKIVGKTLAMFTKGKEDPLNKSLNILGWGLFDKTDKVQEAIIQCRDKNIKLFKEITDLIPEDNELKKDINALESESADVENILHTNLVKAVQNASEKDIANQCKTYSQWDEERVKALEEQVRRLSTAQRLSHIEELKKSMKERETKLWFFQNEEDIELEIEEKEAHLSKNVKKDVDQKIDEEYIPPQIR